MKEEKYWLLVSKKITGEATAEELQQLEELINSNPEWETNMENLQELWNSKPHAPQPGKQQKNEDAYLSHISRLKEMAPDFKLYSAFDQGEVEAIPVKKPFYKRWLTYAAAAVFVACIILLSPLFAKKENVI